jgi:hypothetical protein
MRKLGRVQWLALATLTIICGLAFDAVASDVQAVPEIDGSFVPAAIGVVTAGVMMLRARRNSKSR